MYFAILYDYPSWDRNYRPQRGVRIEAENENEACVLALVIAPSGAKILRCEPSRRRS